MPHQRDHYFRKYLNTLLRNLYSGFHDSPHLHIRYFRIDKPQPAPSVTEHRVEFMELVDSTLYFFDRQVHLPGHLKLSLFILRQEFMQRRVQKPYGTWTSVKLPEDSCKITPLKRQQFCKGFIIVLERSCKLTFEGFRIAIG